MKRCAGVLMPITSLPSAYGIGTLGKEAKAFARFLKKAGQSYWQVLPAGPTGFGDSPYQSFSTFAGNPYMIDLDQLNKDGLLEKKDYESLFWGDNEERIDYGTLYNNRYKVLRIAADHLDIENKKYKSFIKKNAFWLEDYALFMALKNKNNGKSYQEWDEPLRVHDETALAEEKRELETEITFYEKIQYFFFKQWFEFKNYVNKLGIGLIGDVPIYVSPDSADIWADPKPFQLDETYHPENVAGVPPDGFTADGQLWGNPLYNWDYLKETGYEWWIDRVKYQMSLVDVLRIDHFRGFESYYAIPYGDTNARRGVWEKGPGIDLFKAIEAKLGKLDIIAEDLGYLTPEVIQMVKDTGFLGMKVLEFAFDVRDTTSGYEPHCYDHNCVVYIGTHDNETIMGFMKNALEESKAYAIEYLKLDKKEGYNWGFIRGAYASVADLAVIQYQDILGLGNEARINTPSTTGCNWMWRTVKGSYTNKLANKLYRMSKLYGRLSQ